MIFCRCQGRLEIIAIIGIMLEDFLMLEQIGDNCNRMCRRKWILCLRKRICVSEDEFVP